MTGFELSSKELRMLEALAIQTSNAKELRRVQALLWLEEGDSVQDVAERLRVHGRTIYNWVRRFQVRRGIDISERLSDGERSGRPRTAHGIIDPIIKEIIDQDPGKFGYRASVWTAALLQHYLEQAHRIKASWQSVSLAINRLSLRWKRPLYQLSLRSTTWRQAKGGLKVGQRSGNAR